MFLLHLRFAWCFIHSQHRRWFEHWASWCLTICEPQPPWVPTGTHGNRSTATVCGVPLNDTFDTFFKTLKPPKAQTLGPLTKSSSLLGKPRSRRKDLVTRLEQPDPPRLAGQPAFVLGQANGERDRTAKRTYTDDQHKRLHFCVSECGWWLWHLVTHNPTYTSDLPGHVAAGSLLGPGFAGTGALSHGGVSRWEPSGSASFPRLYWGLKDLFHGRRNPLKGVCSGVFPANQLWRSIRIWATHMVP